MTYEVYNGLTDTIFAPIVEGRTVVNPPCDVNIEANVTCNPALVRLEVVTIELMKGEAIVASRGERVAPYFLFGDTPGGNIYAGRVGAGNYTIRTQIAGAESPPVSFTFGTCDPGNGRPSSAAAAIVPNLPTKTPSAAPSSTPPGVFSATLSSIPSDSSSAPLSDVPSTFLCQCRSSSDVPTAMPSSIPSSIPSDVPSGMPSDKLSAATFEALSGMPSSLPSIAPSEVPSSSQIAPPAKAPIGSGCAVSFDVVNARVDTFVASLVDGGTVLNPPCQVNIEAVVACTPPLDKGVVALELRSGGLVVQAREERVAPYFLFGDTPGGNIYSGRILSGLYNIRTRILGAESPPLNFSLAGTCVP